MKPAPHDHMLPEDVAEVCGLPPAGKCAECGQPFTAANVHTEDGWKETRISGLCEDCFDEITAEPEDDYPEDEDAPAF